MGRLIYGTIASLDGYISDEQGNFDWAAPDEEVHTFVNDLQRPVGTYLYGRRMYETMAVWETIEDDHPAMRDFAGIWRAADKIVYSRTLEAPSSAKTRIEREFDPGAVRELKSSADRDLSVGGPHLASEAFAAGLVDEVQLFVSAASATAPSSSTTETRPEVPLSAVGPAREGRGSTLPGARCGRNLRRGVAKWDKVG